MNYNTTFNYAIQFRNRYNIRTNLLFYRGLTEIINEHGCSCETSNSISISFNPSPNKPSLSNTGDLVLCSGSDQYLSITNYNENHQYIWPPQTIVRFITGGIMIICLSRNPMNISMWPDRYLVNIMLRSRTMMCALPHRM